MLWRTVVDAKNVLALHRSLRPCAGKLDQGPNASLPRHIPGTDQPLTLTRPDSESPLAAESVPNDASGLYKIAHSVDGNGWKSGHCEVGLCTCPIVVGA
jgi:hypothetical protein